MTTTCTRTCFEDVTRKDLPIFVARARPHDSRKEPVTLTFLPVTLALRFVHGDTRLLGVALILEGHFELARIKGITVRKWCVYTVRYFTAVHGYFARQIACGLQA
jgi:hypothetical protein